MSEAAGTKVLRELNASRADIVTGPAQARSVSIFRPPGIAAAWADLQLARLHTTRQQRMNGALGKVMSVPRTLGAGGGGEESRAGR